jgi:hypothetical protein
VVGDCVQNLRSSLDHLVFALAEKHSGPLSEEDARACQFPIIRDETRKGQTGAGPSVFQNNVLPRDIKDLSPAAQTIIEMQPYKLGTAYKTHFLWELGELSNTDKHRFVHVVSWYSKVMRITRNSSAAPMNIPRGAKFKVYGCIVEGETVIAKIPDGFLDIIERDEQMNVKIEAGVRFRMATCVEKRSLANWGKSSITSSTLVSRL